MVLVVSHTECWKLGNSEFKWCLHKTSLNNIYICVCVRVTVKLNKNNEVDLSFESDSDRKYWNQWARVNSRHHNISLSLNLKPRISNHANHVVDIWSNNGLGTYSSSYSICHIAINNIIQLWKLQLCVLFNVLWNKMHSLNLFYFFFNFVGEYLWEHIMQGELRSRPDNLYKHGEKTINNIKYRWVSSV